MCSFHSEARSIRRRLVLLPFRRVSREQKLAEVSEVVEAAHFIVELRVHHEVEVVVYLLDLREVLVLHLAAGLALRAVLSGVGEQGLVDDDVVDVDFLLGELDGEALGLVDMLAAAVISFKWITFCILVC